MMPPPQPSEGVHCTNPEAAAELSDDPANISQTPTDAGVALPHGVTQDQEMGGLLPPSHWTQLAEVGEIPANTKHYRGGEGMLMMSLPLPANHAEQTWLIDNPLKTSRTNG